MRLTLSARILLWIAKREQEGLLTDEQDIYNYWKHQKGVNMENITAAITLLISQEMVRA
jgi:hypothetical protein